MTKGIIYDIDSQALFNDIMQESRSEQEAEDYLFGDLWLDCDYLITSERTVWFVAYKDAIVVRDTRNLRRKEYDVLAAFAKSMTASQQFQDLKTIQYDELVAATRLPCDHPAWQSAAAEFCRLNNSIIIAYRGGQSYTYTLYRFDDPTSDQLATTTEGDSAL